MYKYFYYMCKISSNTDKILRILFGIMKVNYYNQSSEFNSKSRI